MRCRYDPSSTHTHTLSLRWVPYDEIRKSTWMDVKSQEKLTFTQARDESDPCVVDFAVRSTCSEYSTVFFFTSTVVLTMQDIA